VTAAVLGVDRAHISDATEQLRLEGRSALGGVLAVALGVGATDAVAGNRSEGHRGISRIEPWSIDLDGIDWLIDTRLQPCTGFHDTSVHSMVVA
jgi:hypothetical protein